MLFDMDIFFTHRLTITVHLVTPGRITGFGDIRVVWLELVTIWLLREQNYF